MTLQTARIPILDETGHFSDIHAPVSVAVNADAAAVSAGAALASQGTASGAAGDAETARDAAAGSASTASTQAGIATTKAGDAETARAAAVVARAGAETAQSTVAALSLTASATTLAAGAAATAVVSGAMPNLALTVGVPVGQPTAYELRGTASPVGVITPASAGIYHTDTAGTTGAWRRMSTGTTNTSWTVTVGDTGWRNVLSLSAGVITSGAVLLRRINAGVELMFVDAVAPNGAAGSQVIFPSGTFTDYVSTVQVTAMLSTGSPTSTRVSMPTSGRVTMYTAATTGNSMLNGMLTLSTVKAWPTVLLGTAA